MTINTVKIKRLISSKHNSFRIMNHLKITQIHHLKDHILEISFDDNCIKQYDFSQLIEFKGIAELLQNIDYFKTVKIIDDGRAFGWDNGYDCCADWARYYAKDTENEWKDFDDSIDLKQRMKLSQQRLKQRTT